MYEHHNKIKSSNHQVVALYYCIQNEITTRDFPYKILNSENY